MDETQSLTNFAVERVLSAALDGSVVHVLARHTGTGERATVSLRQRALTEELAEPIMKDETSALELSENNDKYWQFIATVNPTFSGLRVQVVCPADDDDVAKLERAERFVFRETAEMYRSITLRWVEDELPQSKIQWVLNILDGTAEAERVVASDPDPETGWVLVPDFKWDLRDSHRLYMLAIVRSPALRSIRDLRGSHVPMLRSLRDGCMSAIRERFGVDSRQVRAYFHYVPSFWQLHVHFVHTCMQPPAFGLNADRAWMLDHVIELLTLAPSYFEDATLPVHVMAHHPLGERFLAKTAAEVAKEVSRD